jgi:hypothetical protein
MQSTNAAAVDNSLQLRHEYGKHFEASATVITCCPICIIQLIWARWLPGRCSGLYASVFCITAASELYVSVTSEKTEKGMVSRLVKRAVVVLTHKIIKRKNG